MTLNDLEWLFHDKMRFWPALLESERLSVRNSTTTAILRCSVHFTIYMYLYLCSYHRETALFLCGSWASCSYWNCFYVVCSSICPYYCILTYLFCNCYSLAVLFYAMCVCHIFH